MVDNIDLVINARSNVDEAMRNAGRSVDDLARKTEMYNTKTIEGAKALSKAVEEHEQLHKRASSAEQNRFDQLVAQYRRAHSGITEVKEATEKLPPIFSELERHIGRAFSVVAIEEFLRKSFTAYADVEEGMIRIQRQTGATEEQMKSLGHTFSEAGRLTGEATTKMQSDIQHLISITGMAEQEAEAAFSGIAENALLAGTGIDTMVKEAAVAYRTLGVEGKDLKMTLAGINQMFDPQQAREFASVMPRLADSMDILGIKGKDAAIGLAAIFKNLESSLGSTRLAASALNSIFSQLETGSSKWAKMVLPDVAQFQNVENGAVKMLDAIYQRFEGLGMFSGDPMRRAMLSHALGVDQNTLRALQEVHRHIAAIKEEFDKGHLTLEQYNKQVNALSRDSKASLRELGAAFEDVGVATGDFMKALGADEGLKRFSESLRATIREIEVLKKLMTGQGDVRSASPENPLSPERRSRQAVDTLFGQGTNKWIEDVSEGIRKKLGLPSGGFNVPGTSGNWGEPQPTMRPPPPSKPTEPGRGSTTGGVHHYQSGGIVHGPTMGMIGEAGPAMIIPLGRGGGNGGDRTTEENTMAIKELTNLLKDSRGGPFGGGGGEGGYGEAATSTYASLLMAEEREFAYTPGAEEAPTVAIAGQMAPGGAGGGYDTALGGYGRRGGGGAGYGYGGFRPGIGGARGTGSGRSTGRSTGKDDTPAVPSFRSPQSLAEAPVNVKDVMPGTGKPGDATNLGGQYTLGDIQSAVMGGAAGGGPSTPGVPGALYDPVSGKVGSQVGEQRPGHIHAGDDIATPVGTPMYAAKDGIVHHINQNGAPRTPNHPGEPTAGVVMRVDWLGPDGKPDGTWSYYMHGKPSVKEGDHVKGGQVIGTSGSAAGVPHVHYEFHDKSGTREPMTVHGVDPKTRRFTGGQISKTSPVKPPPPVPPGPATKDFHPTAPGTSVVAPSGAGTGPSSTGTGTDDDPGVQPGAKVRTGTMSYYDKGIYTSTGERRDSNTYTAAVPMRYRDEYGGVTAKSAGEGPQAQYADVTDMTTGKTIRVRINDVGALPTGRGQTERIIDVSPRVMKELGGSGLKSNIKVTPLPRGKKYTVGPVSHPGAGTSVDKGKAAEDKEKPVPVPSARPVSLGGRADMMGGGERFAPFFRPSRPPGWRGTSPNQAAQDALHPPSEHPAFSGYNVTGVDDSIPFLEALKPFGVPEWQGGGKTGEDPLEGGSLHDYLKREQAEQEKREKRAGEAPPAGGGPNWPRKDNRASREAGEAQDRRNRQAFQRKMAERRHNEVINRKDHQQSHARTRHRDEQRDAMNRSPVDY